MYLTLQNVSWLLKRQNVVIIFVWMPYIGVRTYFHSNYIQQFQIQHKIFCSLFHLPSCLFQLSEMVYLMHREIMESRIPSNYFYIPFVYICFIYVDQRTRISVQRYCNNRMYILVKEYRIIFWVMQVLFTHVRLLIDYFILTEVKIMHFYQFICPLKNKRDTTSYRLILKHPTLFFNRIR